MLMGNYTRVDLSKMFSMKILPICSLLRMIILRNSGWKNSCQENLTTDRVLISDWVQEYSFSQMDS